MTAWTTRVLDTDGERIQYETTGDGEQTVVFCHGLGGNHAIWYQQVPVFARRFSVMTWSQRGFGYSTDDAGVSSPAAAVRDLDALLDHLGIERAHLIGQSMGGWAVLGYALHAPSRVRSLAICDSTAGVTTERMRELRGASAPRLPEAAIGAHPAIGDDLRREDLTKAFLYQQLGGFQRVDPAKMIGHLMSTNYPLDEIRALDLPVLFVVGSEDELIPPTLVHEAATVFGDARVVEIERAGHSPYFERPDVWNETVLAFLRSVSE